MRKTSEADLAINAQGLEYRYTHRQSPVLSISKWQVNAGERLFLQGASGSGKSTLLHLLCGLLLGKGALSVAGANFSALSASKRDKFRARHIGVVFQQFNLIPYLSMLDNVVLAASLAGDAYSASTLRAEGLLEQVGLAQNLWRQPAKGLSIGQQQRVAIARALINKPEILLLDEPTSALDQNNRERFMDVLHNHLKSYGTTTILVSHDQSVAHYFDRIVALSTLSSRPLVDVKNAH